MTMTMTICMNWTDQEGTSVDRRNFLKSTVTLLTLGSTFFSTVKKSFAEAGSMGPLLDPWSGGHGGTPQLDLVKKAEFKDALLKGMDLKRAELKIITDQMGKPTFENTIVVFEDAGRPFSRANRIFDIYTSTMN